MKRWILACLIVIGLTACGRSDQPNTGAGPAPESYTYEPLVTVEDSGTPRPAEATVPPYIPAVNGTMLVIDMVAVGRWPAFAVTMQATQTIHLFSSLNDISSFEWGIEFDPASIAASRDGNPLASIEGFTFDEPTNILLKPLAPGTIVFTVFLQYQRCVGCDTAFRETTYTITVH